MAKIGYARVSTRGQNDDRQVDDLTALVSVPLAVSPWVVLAVASPSALAVAAGLAAAVAAAAVVLISAMLWSLRSQKAPGLAAARVGAGAAAIEGCFAVGYYLMPAAFSSRLDKAGAAYFSVSTATATGTGGIYPVTGAARLVVTAQLAGSVVLVVTAVGAAVARLVATR